MNDEISEWEGLSGWSQCSVKNFVDLKELAHWLASLRESN
tara:strand:+ start:310 stop:429 length:120 start_codon:yes stop_codon:yes gene_type:complete